MKRTPITRILKSFASVLFSCAIPAMLASPSFAHDMWLTAENPAVGKPLHLLVGYGHAFPEIEELAKDKISPAYVLGPEGRIETKMGEKQDFLTVSPLKEGSYIAVGGREPQFYTKTPEGSKPLPKNQVEGATESSYSVKFAKVIVNIGKAKGDVSKPVGQMLELVPLVNPATVKPGGDLPVQILFDGKPLPKAQVFATFAGFSKDAGSFAFAGRSDKDGKVNVKVWSPGEWLLLTKNDAPPANPAECDKTAYGAALTLEIGK